MRTARRRGFTLIELLTVITISSLLIGLIVYPLFQSFNLLRQGQAMADAQDRARIISDRVKDEIGNAVAVRDNTGIKGSITVVVPGKPDAAGKQDDVPVTMPYAKIDIVRPAQGDPTRGPSGAFINPDTGKEDPTQSAPKGQVVLPLAAGATVVRYFIGLRQPLDQNGLPSRYANPYEGVLMKRGGGRDNLFSLFRAEVQPYVYTTSGPRVNLALFQDANNDNVPDDIDDPAFFTFLPGTDYNPATRALTAPGTEKSKRIRAWLGQGFNDITDPNDPAKVIRCPLGRATIVTELQRYDMIQPLFDRRTRDVVYDNTFDAIEPTVQRIRPRIIPLAQFKPTRISSDPAQGEQAVRLGEETENAEQIAPDVYTTQYGGWTSTLIRTWPTGWNRLDPATNEYLVGRTDPRNGQAGIAPGFSIYIFDPDSGGEETLDGTEVFDVRTYEQGVAGSSDYPFSRAIQQADSRSGWLTSPDVAKFRSIFEPYFPDSATGKLLASFQITEVGAIGTPPPVDNPNNLPEQPTGLALSPLQADLPPPNGDAGYKTSPYSPQGGTDYGINRAFNRVWNEHPELRPDIHRFIDLRVTAQGDGTASPLDPNPSVGFPRAHIVPGSEEVTGPDQIPGEHYGQPILYTRTPRVPGPNQYRINYVDLAEPDYSVLGLSNPPPSYDPANFVSAVVQPRYKAGYIELNSDPNAPLPQGTFQVFYRFQFTRPNDVFAVDYDSRQVMSINLTIRTFPQSNVSPEAQAVSLKTTAIVRNFIR